MKTLSVITPCFNEEANVREVYDRVRAVVAGLRGCRYEHIFIDNASTDNTVAILNSIAAEDRNVRLIINTRNIGPVRSPIDVVCQTSGDAVVGIVADLHDVFENSELLDLAAEDESYRRRSIGKLKRVIAATEIIGDYFP